MAIAAEESKQPKLVAGLGLLDSTMLVMGGMIGSGIFIVSAGIARDVQSPLLLMMVWVITGLMTLTAALSYGELAAMMPRAGGQYVYLREAFGPFWGFLYGWTFFLVIQTGTVAAVAVAFSRFTAVFLPEFLNPTNRLVGIDFASGAQWGVNTQQVLAILLILLLTWVNTRGVRTGAIVQNVFTIAKIGALLLLAVLGLALGRNDAAVSANFTSFWNVDLDFMQIVQLVGVAMVGSLFSADSWNNVTFTAGEMRNPKRDLPLSLTLGVGVVCGLYVLCNYVYLQVLPMEAIQNAPQDRVGTAAVSAFLGSGGATWMAAAIMVSTFGCVNGLLLAGARVYYAMAKDGLFFARCAELDPKTSVPANGLWLQAAWACALTLTGRYGDLLDYVIFAVLLFYALTIAGLFILRITQPSTPRPYRAIGYPVLPAIYIVAALAIEILLLLYKPMYTWPGLLIVLTGAPVYLLWKRKEA
jgi:basic amino acid/polyamine antiporter, APA family